MPELPEVETVRAGLERILDGATISRIDLRRRSLRSPIPAQLPKRLAGQPVLAVRRRAKYLLIDTPNGTLLCHLGMTGTWRLAPAGSERPHDHCYLHLQDGRRLAFRDPRRFGLLDLIVPGGEATHRRLVDLGVEPLDRTTFTTEYLVTICRGRRQAIKSLIMDQSSVVGVGNIYAQEALFRTGLRPQRAAGRIPRAALATLVDAIRAILLEAISAGGSTISDFRQAGGDSGYFQTRFCVYGRAGEPCLVCATTLKGGVVGGRGTTWCHRCQH